MPVVETGVRRCEGQHASNSWTPFVRHNLSASQPEVLPIESPHRFELTINLSTAKALGITMPTALVAQADEVFE